MTNKSNQTQHPSTMTTTPPVTVSEYEEVLQDFFKSMGPQDVTSHLMFQHCAAVKSDEFFERETVANDIYTNGCIATFVQTMYELFMRQQLAAGTVEKQ